MEQLQQQIRRWVEEHKEEMVADIAALVAVPSKRGAAEEGRPFGPQPARALDVGLALCEKYGFAVKNYDYYVGTADMGTNPPRLDILAHLDVVDEGDGWDTDPFTVTVRDGILFGRGVADDKGPAVAALYAMRAVRELGVPMTGNTRLILGTAEETGSEDLPYYFQREASAPNSFSPDSEFPIYNTEKGRCRPHFSLTLDRETALPRVEAIHGGTTLNIVPAKAEAVVLGLTAGDLAAAEKAAGTMGVALETEAVADGLRLKVTGASAHASTPEEGNNAITALLAILAELPLADQPSARALRALAQRFPHGDGRGQALGIAMEDHISGPLTMSFNLLTLEEGKLTGACDGRVPLCATAENCRDVAVKRLEEAGFQVEAEMVAPHHVPEEEPFIQTLLQVYEEVTGEKGACLATGGGTYVHDIPGGVAFGPARPGVQTNIHGANENIPLEELLLACEILALAIARICA